jgi:hypothetical protein
MLAESGPAERPAGKYGVNANASAIVEGEVENEVPDYCGLEVLSLPHAQP